MTQWVMVNCRPQTQFMYAVQSQEMRPHVRTLWLAPYPWFALSLLHPTLQVPDKCGIHRHGDPAGPVESRLPETVQSSNTHWYYVEAAEVIIKLLVMDSSLGLGFTL